MALTALRGDKTLAKQFDAQMNALKKRERFILELPESRMDPEKKREQIHKIRQAESAIASKVREAYLRAGI